MATKTKLPKLVLDAELVEKIRMNLSNYSTKVAKTQPILKLKESEEYPGETFKLKVHPKAVEDFLLIQDHLTGTGNYVNPVKDKITYNVISAQPEREYPSDFKPGTIAILPAQFLLKKDVPVPADYESVVDTKTGEIKEDMPY